MGDEINVLEEITYEEIRVGDLIVVSQNEKSPCDIIILDSSNSNVLVDSYDLESISEPIIKKSIDQTSSKFLIKFS